VKVCLLCYRGNKYCGGQGVYLYYLSRELRRLGHEVDIMVGPPYPDVADEIRVHKLESLNLYDRKDDGECFLPQENPFRILTPFNLYELAGTKLGMFPEMVTFSIRAYLKVRGLLSSRRFDIIHDNQGLAYGLLLMKTLKTPVIATIHHPLPIDTKADLAHEPSDWEKIKQILFYPPAMQGIVARRLDGVITDSESSAREVTRAFKVPKERIRMIYPGVDTTIFRGVDGHNKEHGRLIMVGRTGDRKKGILYLLQALYLLKKANIDIKLTIVDKVNPNDSYALKLIRDHNLDGVVTFTGRLSTEQLVQEYSAAEIAVTSSIYEGFGFPAAEAMACEIPVIATRGGALPEVVKDGETGILVPPQDPYALARAIKRLLDDEQLRLRMGSEGRKRVKQCFSWDQTAKQTVDVYKEMQSSVTHSSG